MDNIEYILGDSNAPLFYEVPKSELYHGGSAGNAS